MRAYACNQLFRRMHHTRYHIATKCIIKRGNPRGEARDLYFRTAAKRTQEISGALKCVTAMRKYQ